MTQKLEPCPFCGEKERKENKLEKMMKAVRVIEYIGPESWIKQTLSKSYLITSNKLIVSDPHSTQEKSLREVSRTVTELKGGDS